jgi:regulator of protease activity HflC (stomatin/prohibitin superfamily)
MRWLAVIWTGALGLAVAAALTGPTHWDGRHDWATTWWLIAAGPFVLGLSATNIVPEWQRVVVLRMGRFAGVRGPGIVLVIPFFEWITSAIDIRVRTAALTSETAMTRDSVSVKIEAIMIWRVQDPRKVALEVQDYVTAMQRAGMVSLRETIGSVDLDTLLTNMGTVDETIKASTVKKTAGWGATVQSVDIKDITIASDLQAVMSRDAQAQREQRARVTLAKAEGAIASEMAHAAAIYDSNPTALMLRQMELVHEMGKDNATIIVPTEMLSSVSGIAQAMVAGVVGARADNGASGKPDTISSTTDERTTE